MAGNRYENLDQLGGENVLPSSPSDAIIERVKNPCEHDYMIRLVAPEFTSICPVTGQPDFAHIVLDYCPNEWIVESKAYKMFLGSFRNHGDFHEACTTGIARRIIDEISPKWLRIGGYWYPRGGIPIDVFYQYGEVPKGVWIPDQGVAPYRGRG